ncbi:hypothetical protein PENSPDRAFT_662511 [Peniophora sp. CONT]|nr:hypothetical protein PENSPDRAFT_662511 [Peniophora sp. CONT]
MPDLTRAPAASFPLQSHLMVAVPLAFFHTCAADFTYSTVIRTSSSFVWNLHFGRVSVSLSRLGFRGTSRATLSRKSFGPVPAVLKERLKFDSALHESYDRYLLRRANVEDLLRCQGTRRRASEMSGRWRVLMQDDRGAYHSAPHEPHHSKNKRRRPSEMAGLWRVLLHLGIIVAASLHLGNIEQSCTLICKQEEVQLMHKLRTDIIPVYDEAGLISGGTDLPRLRAMLRFEPGISALRMPARAYY